MNTKFLLLLLCMALWAPEALALFIPSLFDTHGSSQSGGTGGGSSQRITQYGMTAGDSFGSAGAKGSYDGFNIGFGGGLSLSNFNVDNKDSSFSNANGAGSSTQGVATSNSLTGSGGWNFFGLGEGKASSSSNAAMNSKAQTIWRPNGPFGPSGAVAVGGGTAGANANSGFSFGSGFLSLANTKSSVKTNIKTFGNDNGSGSTGAVVGSSRGFGLFGGADSNTAVQMGGTSQHAGPFGTSIASAGGQGNAQGSSRGGLSNLFGISSSNVKVTMDTFAGNGHASSSSSTSGSSNSGMLGLFG